MRALCNRLKEMALPSRGSPPLVLFFFLFDFLSFLLFFSVFYFFSFLFFLISFPFFNVFPLLRFFLFRCFLFCQMKLLPSISKDHKWPEAMEIEIEALEQRDMDPWEIAIGKKRLKHLMSLWNQIKGKHLRELISRQAIIRGPSN